MITINHPSVQTEGNAVTISYPILQDGHAPRTLSFTVDSRFRDFLNPGRADGALVALLPWISQQGGQVRVLPAISAHLYPLRHTAPLPYPDRNRAFPETR